MIARKSLIMRVSGILTALLLPLCISCTTTPPTDESSRKATEALNAVAQQLLNSSDEREKVYGLIVLGREAEVRTVLDKQPRLINEPTTIDRPEVLMEAAVRYGSLSLIRYFISQKADLNIRCSQGATIVEIATALREKDRYETVKLLLLAGASPNPLPREPAAETYSSSPLHRAVATGHHALVRLLLEKGANPNVKDREGDTPQHHLFSWRHEELPFDLLKLLLKHGADPNLSNQDGENVLFHAPLKNRSPHWPAAIRAVVQHGADVNHRSADGDTPLHHASRLWVYRPHLETLLALGADPTIENNDGDSPLSEAVWELNWLKERKTASPERIRERETVLALLQQHASANRTDRWSLVKKLAETGKYSEAAQTSVKELSGDYPNRQYAVWKWWEAAFGERTDYLDMSRHFGDSLFDLYDRSSPEQRRIITEIFGRPHFDVSRPAMDLRAEIETKNAPTKSK